MRYAIWLALVACKGGGVHVGETDDTDLTGDSDTVDTNDTDVTVDTDTIDTTTTFEFGGTVDAPDDVDIPPGDVRVIAVGNLFAADGSDFGSNLEFVLGETGADDLVAGGSADFLFHLPLVPPDEQFVATDVNYPTMELAGYLIGAYVDTDGSGGPTDRDSFVGGSSTFLAYARGDLSPDAVAIGLEEGWNVLVLVGQDATAVAIEDGYDGYHVPGNLLEAPQGDLVCTLEPDLDGTVAVGLVNLDDSFADRTLVSVAVEASGTDTEAVLPGPIGLPPIGQVVALDPSSDLGINGTILFGLAWDDTDQDGEYDADSEAPLASSYSSSEPGRLAMYLHATDLRAGFIADAYGWQMGWMLAEDSGSDVPAMVPWDDGMRLGDEGF
jgi:hypothetical protein